jgi:uncharacterized protein (DUF885 family)
MPSEFVQLAERVVDSMLGSNPEIAESAGDHRLDSELVDFSATAVADVTTMLRDASDALAQVDPDELDLPEQIDLEILNSYVDRRLFEVTQVREHEWNPLRHNPGPLLFALIERSTAPVEERLTHLAKRMAAIPDAMATAHATLQDCPHVHLETAAGQFAGAAGLLRDQIPVLLATVPSMAAEVTPRADAAVVALEEMSEWLRERATEAAGRDPRLGRRLWEARLWHTLDTGMSASSVLSAAEQCVREVSDRLRRAAAEFAGGLENDETVRRAFAQLGTHRPDNATIVGQARECLAETTAFVGEHDLVSLVDDRCEVVELPEFARGVTVAYCDAPGPLQPAGVPTLYSIAPPPADWLPERVESFYREYNNDALRNLTVHEAMPGHFLQLAHSRRYRGSTRTRALCHSGPFIEGWAVYAEEMMADAGYGGPAVRLQQLKMALRMSINALLDQHVHCDGMTEAEAMALMVDKGFQEEAEAAGKWRRALLSSTQLSTYFVGYTEVKAIASARPAGVKVRDWHDRMLSYSSIPPRHLRTLMEPDIKP